MADLDFLSENPKLIQRLIATGSIPPPSSNDKKTDFRYQRVSKNIPV
jgi:hypothetical protein